jgi:type II secretory pathway predicted ATPase ExeA
MLALADELEVPLERKVDQHRLLKAIMQRLLELAGEGKRVLLCLDEAQAIPVESLEALRLLTNLETEKRKLLQIVLFGQPELNRKLELDSIRQLAQRITFHYHLGPLSRDDLDFYLAHRLRVAGFTGARLFSPGAVKRPVPRQRRHPAPGQHHGAQGADAVLRRGQAASGDHPCEWRRARHGRAEAPPVALAGRRGCAGRDGGLACLDVYSMSLP